MHNIVADEAVYSVYNHIGFCNSSQRDMVYTLHWSRSQTLGTVLTEGLGTRLTLHLLVMCACKTCPAQWVTLHNI